MATLRGIPARRCSHSTLGRIAEAITKPMNSRAMTIRIFHSASAATTIAPATRVAVAARRAVPAIGSRDSPIERERRPRRFRHGGSHRDGCVTRDGRNRAGSVTRDGRDRAGSVTRDRRKQMGASATDESESLRLEARRHGIVLAWPLLRALALAAAGGACLLAPWRAAAVAGAGLLALAAALAVAAVARWDRTRLVLTPHRLLVEHGLFRRRSAWVELGPGAVVEVERTLPGRVLGYGTLIAGELELECVPGWLVRALQQRHARSAGEHTFGG